ncbi:MAG TPA: hypothetical protein VD866_04040, partial [Urbifossiella sp.]|nr:hypothetical protein [Urbifossiella sp.]
LGFWLIELIGEEGVKWGPKYRLFVINATIAAGGALLCFLTVFPTVHDAAPKPGPVTLGLIAENSTGIPVEVVFDHFTVTRPKN